MINNSIKKEKDPNSDKIAKEQDELDKLEEENKKLKQPLEVPRDKLEEKSIEDIMKEAAEELEKQDTQESKDSQDGDKRGYGL